MPENEDKIKKLYDTFVSDGYDMESEEDFRKNLSDSTKRKAAYDALVKEGYEMEPFEEFENNIGFGKIQTPAPEPAVQTEQAWQPTEQEKAEMIASTNRMMQNVETQIQDANKRVDNIQEYGLNPGLQTKVESRRSICLLAINGRRYYHAGKPQQTREAEVLELCPQPSERPC
jgi:hypothetical protein